MSDTVSQSQQGAKPATSVDTVTSEQDAVQHLLRGYQRLKGVSDELFDAQGKMRDVWRPFVSHLAGLTPDGVAGRFHRGNQYLRDTGVFYRKYGEESASERDWPLSHIPVMVSDTDWAQISEGLIQRADLLETVVSDMYGDNRLVAQGHIPAALVAQNPAWLRPMVGVAPASGHFLNFVAFEVGRGPNGQWWVLGDRTEAPSGAGFALENRVATSRVFPNFFGMSNVHRLAGFFQTFRETLNGLRDDSTEQIALLTPGQMNEGFFEHAFLARYLGLLLVEGEDLIVQDGRVQVRTVDGLRPISVLWRRLDASFCDPLELDETSKLGTPGLVNVARQGGLATLNALGTGILETRALMAFLPYLCRTLTGAPLKLPNIATWWCGAKAERERVLANRNNVMIGSAFAKRLPHDDPDSIAEGAQFATKSDAELEAVLRSHGHDLVGQEIVTLSTTPVWADGGLVPRAMSMRVFLARTPEGWQVMPGGYARISTSPDAKAIAMQAGGSVSDVWVLSSSKVPKVSLISRDHGVDGARSKPENLPSRAADNLFWLGRYIERAEGSMRAFRAHYGLRADGVAHDDPLPSFIRSQVMLSDGKTANALASEFEASLNGAMGCAARIRDRFSVDGILALKDLHQSAMKLSKDSVSLEETAPRVGILLRKVTGFSGLVHENMYRSTGWRFLSLGLSIERAAAMATILAQVLDPDAPDGAFDLVLELGDSVMAHRARFNSSATPYSMIELLALDRLNPRSILYHLTRAKEHIDALPGASPNGGLSPAGRLALKAHTQLAIQTPATLDAAALLALRSQIWALSDMLSARYLT
ncbi:MAG: putative circularly permuted ATP-grasp superfamily protein [Paracoccaceae bacterium]|jgi:uncharacterized circularly permuted ATP-grasp superfamily protein/uncharacterized alpha-E superfamily protein